MTHMNVADKKVMGVVQNVQKNQGVLDTMFHIAIAAAWSASIVI